MLCARGLTKSFGATLALRGVDFAVDPGESVAVLGRSGSGKTTLLHCLSGLTPPDEGTVQFDGSDIYALPDRRRAQLRRRQFGVVLQASNLVPELSMLDNVAFPLLLEGVGYRRAESRAHELLRRLDVSHVAERRPAAVSGGEAQRVAIARAVSAGPAVLFADEPTGALDSDNTSQVMRLLFELVAELRMSLVVVTHDDHVASFAARAIKIRDGLITR